MRLTEEQLLGMEQWAAMDLREEDGTHVQELIDEVREFRALVREFLESNDSSEPNAGVRNWEAEKGLRALVSY